MKSDGQLLERLASDLRLAGKAERTVEAYTQVRYGVWDDGRARRLVRLRRGTFGATWRR